MTTHRSQGSRKRSRQRRPPLPRTLIELLNSTNLSRQKPIEASCSREERVTLARDPFRPAAIATTAVRLDHGRNRSKPSDARTGARTSPSPASMCSIKTGAQVTLTRRRSTRSSRCSVSRSRRRASHSLPWREKRLSRSRSESCRGSFKIRRTEPPRGASRRLLLFQFNRRQRPPRPTRSARRHSSKD